MKRVGYLAAWTALLTLSACHSRVILVALINTSAQPISAIIVDYPGATFGVNSLAPGSAYMYKIKPQDSGALKLQFTDAQGKGHSSTGPLLRKNQEGNIEIRLTQDAVHVRQDLH
jgi:hypothetical protein